MSKATAAQPASDLPRPPPQYEGPSGSQDPLLGEDRGRHSDDDIPDDFKYLPPQGFLLILLDTVSV